VVWNSDGKFVNVADSYWLSGLCRMTRTAVQAGHVYEFTGDVWYESGPMVMAFLDVVERALLS
jgi:ABC-type Fe3+-hydroxamate transport system substrate-binding protein